MNSETINSSFKQMTPSEFPPKYRTAEQVGAVHFTHHTSACNCGEAVWQRLPIFVKENFTCVCDQPFNANLQDLNKIGIPVLGSYCVVCLKPQRFSVAHLVRICEGCDEYYLPEYTIEGLKGTPALCKRCDRGTRNSKRLSSATRTRRTKRGSIRIS